MKEVLGINTISIIVPCYNEEKSLPVLYKEIYDLSKNMKDVVLEFIFVDDGSQDLTLSIIKNFSKNDNRVRYISFSRNFGKEAAMYAGLKASIGDYVAIMDADMQDPPTLLRDMYNSITNEDYDCVATRRTTRRGEPFIRSLFAKWFYKLINSISETEIVNGARDFRLMTRQMVNSILEIGEYNRFLKGIFGWVGFKTKWLEYSNIERVAGNTKWSFWKLFLYSLEGIIAFSTVPLAIASFVGIVLCLISLVMVFGIIIKTFLFGDPVAGWPSLACIILFVGGIQLLCMGVLGQYVSKTYLEAKRRPIYLVKEASDKIVF